MPTAWSDAKKEKSYPRLTQNTTVDVAVIGGGLCGVTSAYQLAKEGVDVVLLEAKSLGAGATGVTTAFLTQWIDTDLTDLAEMYGKKEAALIWQSHSEAIDAVEKITKSEKIDCEFVRCPAYVYAFDEKEAEGFKDEQKLAQNLGFNVTLGKGKKLLFDNSGYLEVKKQAKFHPLKFLYHLAEKAEDLGAKIYEKTEVEKVSGKGDPVKIQLKNGVVVTANKVIVATYDPFNTPREVFAKKGMYVSYVLEANIEKGVFPEAVYWDQHNPYYYFRIDQKEKFDRLILGGADHRHELPVSKAKSFKDLESYLKEIIGQRKYQIAHKWAGPILEPSDGIALIGEYKPNHYLAAGFSGNGMTYSIIAARIFTDLILGRKNAWAGIYDPKRPRKASRYFKKGLDYTKELFGGAVKNTIKYRR